LGVVRFVFIGVGVGFVVDTDAEDVDELRRVVTGSGSVLGLLFELLLSVEITGIMSNMDVSSLIFFNE
jgi:hypothetical protein